MPPGEGGKETASQLPDEPKIRLPYYYYIKHNCYQTQNKMKLTLKFVGISLLYKFP